jgi:hypothetical protein
MDIYDAVWECFQHWRFENSHETGQNDKFNAGTSKHVHKVGFGLRL